MNKNAFKQYVLFSFSSDTNLLMIVNHTSEIANFIMNEIHLYVINENNKKRCGMSPKFK